MGETIVTCGHCDGKGVCSRGPNGNSCKSCLYDGRPDGTISNGIFKCSICKGTGWAKQ